MAMPNKSREQSTLRSPGKSVKAFLDFKRNGSGSVGMTFGLMIIPLMGLLGMAVDFSRVATARFVMQDAVDAAMLAAGRAAQITINDPAGAAKKAAGVYFDLAAPKSVTISTSKITTNATATELTMQVTYWVQTPIVSLLSLMTPPESDPEAPTQCKTSKFACQKLSTQATATIASGGNGGSNVEVAMMLDITGSMEESDGKGSTKLATLKVAATDAIDILIWQDQSQHTARLALAPFSQGVNAGSYASAVTGLSATSGTRKLIPCVVERLGANAYTDAAPSSANGWLGNNAGTNAPSGYRYTSTLGSSNYNSGGTCGSSSPSGTEAIVPLTSDKNILKARINGLTASGGTAGHIGTAWAWYLLSPNWNTIWPAASQAGSYADISATTSKGYPLLQKYAILMTDGDYNNQYSSTSSFNQARTLCTNMKAKGITVFTVGFMVSTTAKNFLTSCATSADHYYDATDGDKLKSAFRDIALKISTLRLSM
jgi:Flp pilus assembly protein TadG